MTNELTEIYRLFIIHVLNLCLKTIQVTPHQPYLPGGHHKVIVPIQTFALEKVKKDAKNQLILLSIL